MELSMLSMMYQLDQLMITLSKKLNKMAYISNIRPPAIQIQESRTIIMRSMGMMAQDLTKLSQVSRFHQAIHQTTTGTMDWAHGNLKNTATTMKLENHTYTTMTTLVFASTSTVMNMADAKELHAMMHKLY